MTSIKQIYYENFIMKFKLILWQRFQNFRNYINTKLQNILTAYSEKTEQVINEIDFLTSCLKNFNIIFQSALIFEQNVNAQAELVAITANNFSNSFLNSCQANGENVAQNKSIILNHNSNLKLIAIKFLRRTFSMTMRDSNIEAMKMSRTWNCQYRIYHKYATKY